jgi:uncharacterized membrane protein
MDIEERRNIKDKKFEAWFTDHYLLLILGCLFTFSFLPFLAPILMEIGFIFPAKVIYWIYSFFCHQLPYRSWFLFGIQPYYPLARAGLISVQPFESIIYQGFKNYRSINSIIGNPMMGYKIAICQRDIAIYISILIFGIVFAIRKKKIKPISLWCWLFIGVLPIGLDGISQYLSNISLPIIGIMFRESTPLLRTLTGTLYGFLTGWYIFPSMENLVNRNNKTTK